MKKSYLIMLGLVSIGTFSFAQTKVTFRVNMKNETVSPNGVHIAGDYQKAAGMAADWSPGDALAEAKDPNNDKVYELQVTLAPGTYAYKYVNNNDWAGGVESVPSACQKPGSDNRELIVGTTDLVLDVICFSSCTNCASTIFERNVTFMLTDSNAKFTDVKFKGAMSGWADFQAYDDGTNGDKVANDKTFTAIYKVKDGQYEWGATNKGSWVIQGANRKFTMDLAGKITGDTTYGIPKLGALIDVTFSVDMTNETVDVAGVFISGNFLEALENPIGNWDKDTIKLQPRTTGSDIYTTKLKMYAGKYAYKYWNGKKPAPNDDQPAENYDFTKDGCGEANGVGGHNRVIDFKGATTAKVLKTYVFNSCGVSASLAKLPEIKFGVNPNPANSTTSVSFRNNGMVSYIAVTDLAGRIVLSKNVSGNTIELNLEGLNHGVYMVNAYGTDGSFGVQKLIKN